MGKRCRQAAWGATFALLVAACAVTEAPPSTDARPDSSRSSSSTSRSVPPPVTFPESLADASFVQVSLPDGPCAAGDLSQMTLFSGITGEETWTFPIPRPGAASVIDGSDVYFSFRWDRGQYPGVASVDLGNEAPRWQRFLPTEPQSMVVADAGLIVVTADDVRAIDLETGDDLWVNRSEFDFSNVILGTNAAYAIDNIGVHAIDYATGRDLWQLPIDRPDAIATNGETLAVAAGNRLIAVDIAAQAKLWDTTAVRLGAGDLWVTPTSVAYELAPSIAPGGGVAVLDRTAGVELWRATSIGNPRWVGDDQLISSTANDEQNPAQPFVLFALDARTGEELWRTPATSQAFESVVGTGTDRVITVDPHPAIAGMQRVRLFNSLTGEVIWEQASDVAFDGATVTAGSVVTMYGASGKLGEDRGSVAVLRGRDAWTQTRADGVSQAPELTAHGLLVISGERSPTCLSRALGEPSEQTTAVLSATQSN